MQNNDFIKYLAKENDNFKYLYTQMLMANKVRNNNVVYLFDEVGCGKTTSSIIAMAEIIAENQNSTDENKKQTNILIITPKSVCKQFYNEVNTKLDVSNNNGHNLRINIEELYDGIPIADIRIEQNNNDANIYIINDAKFKYRDGPKLTIDWDLLIIDEAHKIVCNSKDQYIVYIKKNKEGKSKIEEYYANLMNSINNYSKELQEYIYGMKKYIDSNVYDENEYANKEIYEDEIIFLKYLACNKVHNDNIENKVANYYNNRIITNNNDIHRLYSTRMFKNISKLKSKRIVFMTATSYKEDLNIDFLNYVLLASQITSHGSLFKKIYRQNSWWLKKIYGNDAFNEKDLQEAKDSNVSYWFKEIATAIPYDLKNCNYNIIGKNRNVELLEEKGNSLKEKVFDILSKSDGELKNRIVIFVSSSDEGKRVFEKIFGPNTNCDIVNDFSHEYTFDDGKVCKFVMNKFGNSKDIEEYKKENDKIPDILIVTYQVAQEGVNLPTFNYVINYTISDQPGSLEQRYGRIDRLNSKYNNLYNIYYLDTDYTTSIYKYNLGVALYNYRSEITQSHLPVKNLLIGENIQLTEYSDKEAKADLEKWVCMYMEFKKCNDRIHMSVDLIENIKRIDPTLIERCENSDYRQFVYDELPSGFDINDSSDPDEEGSNAYEKKRVLNSNINKLIKLLDETAEMNARIKELNEKKGELGNPGTIIYISENNGVKVECNKIVRQIVDLESKI